MKQNLDFKPYTEQEAFDVLNQRRIAFSKEPNDFRRKMLRNHFYHAVLEIGGEYEGIFAPDMIVEEPHYIFFQSGRRLDGREAVKGYYREAFEHGASSIIPEVPKFAVADWGVMNESVYHYYMPAALAATHGVPTRSDRFYVLHRAVASVWYLDDRARLVSERIYHAAESTYTEITQDQYFSADDMRRILGPLIRLAKDEWERNPLGAA